MGSRVFSFPSPILICWRRLCSAVWLMRPGVNAWAALPARAPWAGIRASPCRNWVPWWPRGGQPQLLQPPGGLLHTEVGPNSFEPGLLQLVQ